MVLIKLGLLRMISRIFRRDFIVYALEFDADMMIKRFKIKQKYMSGFAFEYKSEDKGVLKAVFWADEQMKRNFYTFGDVVSFDATYQRNK